MSWDCCTPTGACQQGPGCPAGGACHRQPGCKDTACPGHPGARVARVGKQHSALRNVMLDAGRAPAEPGPVQYILRRLLQILGLGAVFAIWLLVTAAADAGGPCTDTRKPCATHWEGEA